MRLEPGPKGTRKKFAVLNTVLILQLERWRADKRFELLPPRFVVWCLRASVSHGSGTSHDEPMAAAISPPICTPWYPFPAPTREALPSITHLRFHVGTRIWPRACEHGGKEESVGIDHDINACRALERADGATNSPPRPLSADWHVACPHARRYDGRVLGLSRYRK